MAEPAIPTPGSNQREKPQSARSGQDPASASTEPPKDKVAALREGKTWKRLGYAGAAIGTLFLAIGLGVYVFLRTGGNTSDRGRKLNARLHDPHAKHGGKDVQTDDKDRRLRLAEYRREAEEALILASFYEHEGATDKLRKCLATLKKWKQEEIAINGQPRFSQPDGLVITRPPGEATEKDFWERVTKAIERLSPQLD